jgi:O-antigen ligase
MRDKYVGIFKNLELTGFYLILFFLPFSKVPKNLGIALLILGAIAWRLMDKSIKFRKPDTFEWLLLAMVAVGLISTIMNWPFHKGINGLGDTIKFAMIAFVAKNSVYTHKQIRVMLQLLVAGTVIGLTWGFVELQSGQVHLWEFRNMMVAETSIIVGIVTAALLGVLYADRSLFRQHERVIASIIIFGFLTCMLLMGNRSGLLGFSVFFTILLASQFRNRFSLILGSLVGISAVVALLVFSATDFKGRLNHLFSTQIDLQAFSFKSLSGNDQTRIDYWRLGLEQARQGDSPLFGIGPRNFRGIDANALSFDPPLILNQRHLSLPVHAHNLYLTKLAEEGIAGLLVLLGFLAYILFQLYKYRPRNDYVHWLWVACLGAIVIPFIAGTFYAPFRREVAWIAMGFIGLALNYFHHPDRYQD